MKKAQKIVIVFSVLVLLTAALWWYWERPLSLDTLLPEEQWVRMELEQMLPNNLTGDLRFQNPPMEKILELLPAVRVTRAENRPYVDDECFRITLYKGEAWPTVLYVGSSGRVEIAADMQFDDWKCYEGGEALYRYLYHLSQNLAGTVTVPSE